MPAGKKQTKRWVLSDGSDLPKGTQIGYHMESKFYCRCSSTIKSSGLKVHFQTQKHTRWVACQNKLLGCQASCGSPIKSPAKSVKSPVKK